MPAGERVALAEVLDEVVSLEQIRIPTHHVDRTLELRAARARDRRTHLAHEDLAQRLDVVQERLELAESLRLCDFVRTAGPDNVTQIRQLTRGSGVERALDCSANAAARATAIRATRKWGKIAFVGEGGTVEFNPSPDIIHDQKTIYGSWVTSTWLMEELVERLVRWNLHPADIITHRFGLEDAADAYALMASGKCGKVAVCSDEELIPK